MGHSFFWGLVFILAGVVLIIKFVFKIDIPVVRLILAVVLISVGIRMLIGGDWFFRDVGREGDVIFGERIFDPVDGRISEYNVIFGSGTFYIRDIDSTRLPSTVKINTIFGASRVFLPEGIPYTVKAEAVFSGASLPGGQKAVFGSAGYKSPDYVEGKPALILEADVVFGALDIAGAGNTDIVQ